MRYTVTSRYVKWACVGFTLLSGCSHTRHACHCCCCCNRDGGAPAFVIAPAETTPPAAAPLITSEATADAGTWERKPAKTLRRSYADITADPCFGHAPDHSWLTGQLTFQAASKSWRLRYASVDEDDACEGSVTLVEPGPMASFESGQMVRVEGQLEDQSPRPDAPYRVRYIQPLNRRLPDTAPDLAHFAR